MAGLTVPGTVASRVNRMRKIKVEIPKLVEISNNQPVIDIPLSPLPSTLPPTPLPLYEEMSQLTEVRQILNIPIY